MALLAGGTGLRMRAVGEEDVAGDLIDADPRNFPLGFEKRPELLDRFGVGFDGLVTRHAFGGGGDAHRLTGIFVLMAHGAFES